MPVNTVVQQVNQIQIDMDDLERIVDHNLDDMTEARDILRELRPKLAALKIQPPVVEDVTKWRSRVQSAWSLMDLDNREHLFTPIEIADAFGISEFLVQAIIGEAGGKTDQPT